jgi:hypothetical protein
VRLPRSYFRECVNPNNTKRTIWTNPIDPDSVGF